MNAGLLRARVRLSADGSVSLTVEWEVRCGPLTAIEFRW